MSSNTPATVQLSDTALVGVEPRLLSIEQAASLPTTVRLGRITPAGRPSVPRLEAFWDVSRVQEGALPTSTNRRAAAAASLARVYLNDQLGDCVIAGKMHSLGLWSGSDPDHEGPALVLATDEEVRSQYQGVCGPGDQGCYIPEVLNYFRAQGMLAGGRRYKIDAYVAVDWRQVDLVKTALYVFGTLTIGINLPSAWTSNSVWDQTTSRIVGGHDVACFTGDTKVPLLDGTERTMKELAEGAAGESFWVYSCDADGNVVPGRAHSARKTGEGRSLVKVTLDNGEEIRCTADHRFMLRDGTYREAGHLALGDSLMPLYRKLGVKQMKGYEQVYNPASKKWRFTHRLTAAAMRGGRYQRGQIVHHKDFDKRNNAPDNLEVMSWEEHTRLHAENTEVLRHYAQSEEGRAKSREIMARHWADPEWRARAVEQLGKNGHTACTRRAAEGRNGFQMWTEEDFAKVKPKIAAKIRGRKVSAETRAKLSAAFRHRMETDPEARARLMERQALAAAGASRQQRNGITEAQRQARRKSIKKALAAQMEKRQANNHKVVDVVPCGYEDVYDLTVDVHHNFALSAGVFVHNCIDYGPDGVYVSSWGRIYLITWRAFVSTRWLEECYALLAPLWYGSDRLAPCGIDATALAAMLAQIGQGQLPPLPDPVTPPVPPPAPPPPAPADIATLVGLDSAGKEVARFRR